MLIESKERVLARLAAGLIVSVQAYLDEPLRRPEITAAMAQACVIGGACAVRVQGLADILAVRHALGDTPIIGLWKAGRTGAVITPYIMRFPLHVLAHVGNILTD